MVELKITEIDNLAGNNFSGLGQELEQDKKKKSKKRVSYEDIFSTLNMQVINGKIHIVKQNDNASVNYQQPYWEQKSYERYQPSYPQTFQQQQQQYTKQIRYPANARQPHIAAIQQQQKLQQQLQQQMEAPPLNREQVIEHNKQVFLRKQVERNRIDQIKSTKLFFSATSNLTSNANHNLNKLFRLNGR
jgi:hypothetical protein